MREVGGRGGGGEEGEREREWGGEGDCGRGGGEGGREKERAYDPVYLSAGYQWLPAVGQCFCCSSFLRSESFRLAIGYCLIFFFFFAKASADKDSEFHDCLKSVHSFFKLTQVSESRLHMEVSAVMC